MSVEKRYPWNCGYDGIEIAPFTLAEKPSDMTSAQRAEYRDIIASEGLVFAGHTG